MISSTQCSHDHFILKIDQFFMNLASVPDIFNERDPVFNFKQRIVHGSPFFCELTLRRQ